MSSTVLAVEERQASAGPVRATWRFFGNELRVTFFRRRNQLLLAVAALFPLLIGIGLIGVLTATVASVFVKEHTDSAKEEYRKGHSDLGQQLSVISERLADVEHRLGATDADLAATDSRADADAAEAGPVEINQAEDAGGPAA